VSVGQDVAGEGTHTMRLVRWPCFDKRDRG
jgi:hypothetical protein